MKKTFLAAFASAIVLFGCNQSEQQQTPTEPQVVNLYSHRHYDIDQEIFNRFEQETGIKVNVVKASADELLVRLQQEGANSPADLLVTSDAGRLAEAAGGDFFQPYSSSLIDSLVPHYLRHENKLWTGLTMRARIIVASKERVPQGSIERYEDLALPLWKGKVLSRPSSSLYNQSLLASFIAGMGDSAALAWTKSVRENMARPPKGNDRDQVMAIHGGEGDVALINTYYLGLLLNSEKPEEQEAGNSVYVIFPNQNDRGAHVNVSGAGILKYAPNKANAEKLLEFLLSEEVQRLYADANFEYPVRIGTEPSGLLQSWGTFTMDSLNLSNLGTFNSRAVEIFTEAGWE